ncbi:MAG: response regulator transcription factor [Thermomicrobiales bacterium]
MRILVVEDEAALAGFVAQGLQQAGFAVDLAPDGETALAKAEVTAYDLVVIDRQLPGIHGDEVCRQLVASDPAPRVVMLTAAREVAARIDGLDLGADDYLTKPFDMDELIARIRAVARRPAIAIPAVLAFPALALTVDPARHAVIRDGKAVALSRKEFGVLEAIAGANGRIVSAEDLLERVWDEETDPFTNVVRVTIMNLRRKLGAPPVIETVVGVGYRLVSVAGAEAPSR